ncbi:MAG TPA: PepSY domain-containing protein [Mucilaginibacter sp.]|nr:PepSY domain-containing protein [Mucilaginibacter sp.]
MIRKNIYKWHRICSLIIAVPVMLWAGSGFMHPIMTNLRPAVRTQSLPADTINPRNIRLTLTQALQQNKLDTIYGARLVHIDTNWFYQVRVSRDYNLWYISVKNGQVLPNGDWLYAQYIARLFLEGAPKKAGQKSAPMSMKDMSGMSDMADCCSEAATTVLNNKTGAPVKNVSLIRKFDGEYKSIYCLLPVYRVEFKRDDHIRLYVETAQDRFSIAVDKNRAAFTAFFDFVHTWGWLDLLGKGRILVEMFFTVLGFITALMGLYIFFTTNSKKAKGNSLMKARRTHRITSIIAVLFTLMFTFSGCYHAFSKLGAKEKTIKTVVPGFAVSAIHLDLAALRRAAGKPLANFGLAAVNGKTYWQAYLQPEKSNKAKDLMKDMSAPAVSVVYVSADDGSVLKNGDEVYARDLATQFSGHEPKDITSTELITRFTDEYNFTDKRLPVWKINYPFNHRERFYVETSTGTLAKQTNNVELLEGYSFALFHKHHFMDFAGKTTRDVTSMVGAALQILMVIVGLTFYFRWRNKKQVKIR